MRRPRNDVTNPPGRAHDLRVQDFAASGAAAPVDPGDANGPLEAARPGESAPVAGPRGRQSQ